MGTDSKGEYEYYCHDIDYIDYKDIDKLNVKYIGEADKNQKRGVVLASFNFRN
jgi:ribosomal protein S18